MLTLRYRSMLIVSAMSLLVFHSLGWGLEGKKLKVVTSFSDYARIAEQIGGDRITVDYLSHGDQDPHFVPPKPSLALKLKDADIWVSTGLDLEMWAPTLMDKARNNKIMDGAKGFVTVYEGINLLEIPTTAMTRTEGDIHLYGNPHIHTGPINWKSIAENITIGLIKNDPEGEDFYRANYNTFCNGVDRALFGDELVGILGGDRLCKMLQSGTLFAFLDQKYRGETLKTRLGGWLKEAEPLRGVRVIAYHKNWIYFTSTFGMEIVEYIEHKPGIPPSAKHVHEIIDLIKEQNIKLLLVANYFEHNTPKMIEDRTGIKALFLPLSCGGNEYVPNNFALVDYWIAQIKSALLSTAE
ncbi:MAG TPA: metal ABC transporter substrate-binding protein [archaeon]|nr:metal ABC transporter substrate-binding protein [archaeon]